jgi:hypothetical protein
MPPPKKLVKKTSDIGSVRLRVMAYCSVTMRLHGYIQKDKMIVCSSVYVENTFVFHLKEWKKSKWPPYSHLAVKDYG